MKSLPLVALLLTTTLGCSATEIRVRNDSNTDFQDVIVGGKKYGDIQHGATTDYQHWQGAYGYSSVQLLAGGKSLRIQPYDYVGEVLPGEGKFTYVLTLKNGALYIRAEEDVK